MGDGPCVSHDQERKITWIPGDKRPFSLFFGGLSANACAKSKVDTRTFVESSSPSSSHATFFWRVLRRKSLTAETSSLRQALPTSQRSTPVFTVCVSQKNTLPDSLLLNHPTKRRRTYFPILAPFLVDWKIIFHGFDKIIFLTRNTDDCIRPRCQA